MNQRIRRPSGHLAALMMIGVLLLSPLLAAAAPLSPMGQSTIGNYVWYDANWDGEHTGDANLAEAEFTAGIPGVFLELWIWNGSAYVLDSLDPYATTDATGYYVFKATAAGTKYQVRIAESNYQPGGALYGLALTSAGTYSSSVTMPADPIYDHKTADFGFARSPIQVTKALLNTTQLAAVGETVTFRITITNSGPWMLNVVPLDDYYSPACLTYVTASILPDVFDPVLGRLHWNNVGLLEPLGSMEIDVTFTAANSPAMLWKEGGWQDYAPKGIPDFDQKQAGWDSPLGSGAGWYRCAPVAAANSLWWFDSKFEPAPVAQPGVSDNYPLVSTYSDTAVWDDHDPRNVAPLVDDLAALMGTTAEAGTTPAGLAAGITQFIADAGLATSYTVTPQKAPGFAWVGDEVRRSEDVILLIGFWQESVSGRPPSRVGGHYVTVSGADLANGSVAISDPYRNAAEAGGAGRVLPGAHADLHPAPGAAGDTVHNDAQYISADAYPSIATTLPGGVWALGGYLPADPAVSCVEVSTFAGRNLPAEFAAQQAACDPQGGALWATVEYAVAVSPVANTPMCSPTTNIATVTGATTDTGDVLPPSQAEATVTQGMDLGDLPAGYPTLLVSNGARHLIVSPLRLGNLIDAEADGQPNAMATGDDLAGAVPDDEDGVKPLPGVSGHWTDGSVLGGNGGSLEIVISGGSGVPQVFMDFNGAGLVTVALRDAAGALLPTTPWLPGVYQVYFDIPMGTMGSGPTIPVRVRLSSAGGLIATGLSQDGEVEDYIFHFNPNALSLVTFSAAPAGPAVVWGLGAVLAALFVQRRGRDGGRNPLR